MLRRPGDETIDFSDAREAIENLLGTFSTAIQSEMTDLHVQGGTATIRVRGEVHPVDLGDQADGIDGAIAEIANLTAVACRREINARSPLLEQRIPPRYRVTCTHPANVQDGRWVFSLRLLAETTMPLEQWVADGNLGQENLSLLMEILAGKETILVAGHMGAGKTSLLRGMIAAVPSTQRVLVIEDTAELNVVDRPDSPALVASASAGLSELIAHGFRHDAIRVVVGEIRDHSAMQFLTLAAGGTRAISTIHCPPGVGALIRLHQMVLQSGYHYTMEQVEQAIGAVVTVNRTEDDRRPVSIWRPGS